MKRLSALLSGLVLAVSLVGTGAPAQADHVTEAASNYLCSGTVDHTTIRGNVVVPDGATCVITNSTIMGNVRNAGAPASVRIVDTDVSHNIHLRNVTGSVTIGSADCVVDPQVGRNLMVRDSANVAICTMSVGNNLMLRGNTGRLMARDNMVCNNIRVVGNHLLGMRLLRNSHVVNFTAARNHVENGSRVEANGELPGTPGACKRVVRAAVG